MVATIVVGVLIAAYAAFVIVREVKAHKKAKNDGISQGCLGCMAYKSGKCSSHQNCSGSKK